ncbi:unnamed protein product [Pleuronectes platessa]|uniref:Uncharacterized protein n=1 Tax=Pleuronectes platessa TaxID=8262 RepID=A0A9N7W395_PLEPL|nr:unnamed protein product [Pleuronectes platessa]
MGFHKFLQKETVDLAHAIQYKSAVNKTLVSQRTSQVAEDIYSMAKNICQENNIEEPSLRSQKKQKRMEDYVVEVCHVGPAQTCLKNHQSISSKGSSTPALIEDQ